MVKRQAHLLGYGLAALLLIMGISFIGIDAYQLHRESKQSTTLQSQLYSLYYTNEQSPPATPSKQLEDSTAGLPQADAPKATPIPIREKIRALTAINKEIIGWLHVDGAGVDYPVVQHKDNDYYLHTDAAGKASIYGSIFMDYRNDRTQPQRNTVIYGHNMIDGTMFGSLSRFKQQSFYQEHHLIQLDLPDQVTTWDVFAVYMIDAQKDTIETSYENDQTYLRALNSYRSKSLYATEVVPSIHDEILTLVTCSNETDDTRLVVHAMKKRSL